MPTDVREDPFGKFVIRSGKVSGAWQARAFQGRKSVGDPQTGPTQDDAVERVKSALRARTDNLKRGRGKDGSPSSLEYVEAFDALGPLSPGYEAMLDAHLNAPDHLITTTDLAKAAGYKNWSAANLHYGTLARRLAEEMNYDPPKRPDGSTIWTYALATAPGDGELEPEQLFAALERHMEDPHFEWLLRPQVVEALRGPGSPAAR